MHTNIHTHILTFKLTHRLLPTLYSLANSNTIFPPESFQSKTKNITWRKKPAKAINK